MDPHPTHPRQGAVLAAVAVRIRRPNAANAAEAGIYATLMDALLDRLEQMAEQIPTLEKLTPEATAAALVLVQDISEHLTAALANMQNTMADIRAVLENEADK